MPKEFIFLREYKLKEEIVWEYSCHLLFNRKEINQIIITDYIWKKKGREMITKELVCKLIGKLNKKRLWPTKYSGFRKPFRFETTYEEKKYRLIFWFDDNNSHGLWIKNCFRID